ncbi:MAG: hypothetical protein QM662_04200 [Gordonia sp. (in: high G+C Gram-positive bacteria)]
MADDDAARERPESTDSTQEAVRTVSVDVGISAGVAVLYLLLRLLAISDWDWRTAADVADTVDFDDAISIVFGTLFAWPTLTGIMLMLLLPMIVTRVLISAQTVPRQWHLSTLMFVAAVGAATVALILTFGEWWVLIGAVALSAVLVAAVLSRRRHHVLRAVVGRTGLIALLASLVLSVVVDTPWMSREEITTTHGVVDGYVLEVEPGFLKVLTHDGREFRILRTGDVTARTVAE